MMLTENDISLVDLACIKETNESIAHDLIDIKFLLQKILDTLEIIEIEGNQSQF